MKEIEEMVKNSGKFHDKIKSFCDPLVQRFGVSHFYHARITSSGHFIGVNLDRSWEEYFLSDTSHLLMWPDKCQPCKTENGIRLLHKTDNEHLIRLLSNAKEKYSINFSFQIIEKNKKNTNMFGFALNSSDLMHHMSFLKELQLLRLFIRKFQEEFRELYAKLDEHKVDLSNLLGRSFQNVKNPEISQLTIDEKFLKQLKIEIPVALTDRELEVIKHLSKGCSASEIAARLFLSKRTVEHHIDRIKSKFCSYAKSELIQKIHDLELIGYFTF